jgi:hypothetical protein
MKPVNILISILRLSAFITFCLALCVQCKDVEDVEEVENILRIRLDGWYGDIFSMSLNSEYTSFTFNFRDKYEELEIDECVYITALYVGEEDYGIIYPLPQGGDRFIVNLTDVDEMIIKSIHPGKSWVPYSQQIILENVIFNKRL